VSRRGSKTLAGLGAISLLAYGAAAAPAAKAPAPKKATINVVTKLQVKVNRFVKDSLRWQKDVYQVKSGGTVKVVNKAGNEGPHSLSVVAKKDLPRTPAQLLGRCKICEQLGEAHGAEPNRDAPPKFDFLENGVGQDTPPKLDQAGDSALLGENKGDSVTLDVTAKKGTTLYFMCLIHPWMQGKLQVK
jgi:hypothetical protein